MGLENVKIGDKLRYLGGDPNYENNLTVGKEYEVIYKGLTIIILDDNLKHWTVSEHVSNTHCFKLANKASEADRTTVDMFASLSKEVSRLKNELKSVKEELSIQQENLRTWSIESTKMAYDLADLERKTDEHIDMFIDDISMLDERTQIKKEVEIEFNDRELARSIAMEEGDNGR